ncbi:hypothetical protein K431DRAFT_305182 [Polychaeton citri CBS 116435]|uniref:glucokinase n=1 Tax=Polychaeton citri CBS 116435 TaxID=1314669 RepID=A0A9P4Q518_9PEZI|nr:hypothetical protein K431DRAFT_305182 [Polychaeton citri CBS 116435]
MPAGGYGGAGYYQSQPPPMYAPGPAADGHYGGYRGAQTATFDAPSKSAGNMGPMGGVYDQRPVNDDALPHMPSWDQSRSRRVEDDVELEKLEQPAHLEQQQSLLPQQNNDRYYSHQDSGDIGSMSAAPYEDTTYRAQHNYSAYSQQVPMSPYETRSPPPLNTAFAGAHAPAASSYYGSPTSTMPPSYQTHPPSMVGSPPPGVQRKPIQGSWRDVRSVSGREYSTASAALESAPLSLGELRAAAGKGTRSSRPYHSSSTTSSAALFTAFAVLAVLSIQLFLLTPTYFPSLLPFTGRSQLRRPSICSPPNPFPQDLVCPRPEQQQQHFLSKLFSSRDPRKMSLASAAARVAAEFEYPAEDVNRAVKAFIAQMDDGLKQKGATISQIPTYVTAVPNGTEHGLYMAVDLGGTNFRVCSIQLHGNSTFSLTQSKVAIPKELMTARTSRELFSFMAKQIEAFIKAHHTEHYQSHRERRRSILGAATHEEVFSLGFTFSFPVQQYGINKGTLIRWTKGFDIKDTIGKDVCELLQREIDILRLPVRVAALVNDTVGTLMARSYTSPGETGTLLGAIFGTGTNGAYVERLDKITKLNDAPEAEKRDIDDSTGDMIVNTEWGSFDNHLSVLPNTQYDKSLDDESNNPGVQMFEKRVSGMFLGEILRRAIISLINDEKAALFKDDNSDQNDVHSTTTIADDSLLYQRHGLDTAFLSLTASDSSQGLKATRQALDKTYGVSATSAEDAEAVRVIAGAIGKRAARLSAVAIAAVVISTDSLNKTKDGGPVDIGVDGSLVEFYPLFEDYMREALREIPEIGEEGEKRIRIGIAKDGSGVGAALIALVADRVLKSKCNGEPDGVAKFTLLAA